MTNALTLLHAAKALARARREKAALRYRIHGGLTSEGGQLAFTGGQHYRPDDNEPFDSFMTRVSDTADGPVIFGGMPELPGTAVRWTATIEPPGLETPRGS
jgi:hypothetical protein